jgi:transcriptional regulator with XRE-family HTH domain
MNDVRRLAGDLIRQAREESDLSQAELARRAGMPRSVLNAYERHRRQPGVDVLARIARAAGRELRIGPPAAPVDPVRAARILEQVLDLAEELPQRRRGRSRRALLTATTPQVGCSASSEPIIPRRSE